MEGEGEHGALFNVNVPEGQALFEASPDIAATSSPYCCLEGADDMRVLMVAGFLLLVNSQAFRKAPPLAVPFSL